MRVLIACMLSVGLLTSSLGSAQDRRVGSIKFGQTTYNFGSVPEGTKVAHSFDFRNEGNANLLIQRVVSTCGCTAAASTTEPVAPGANGNVKLEFNTTGFSGEKTKTVRVFSNDPDHPEVELSLVGIVESEATIEPARLAFDELVRGTEPAAKEFEVKLRPSAGKKIQSVVSYSKFIKIDTVSNDGTRGRFRVSLDRALPVGELRDRIIINLSKGSETSTLTLPVLGRVVGTISVEPNQVSFGVVEGENKLTRSVKLKNRGPQPIEIVSVNSDTASVTAVARPIDAGKVFAIDINLDASQVTRDLRALIEIRTSSPEEPSVYLSVFGVTPPKLQ